MRRMGARAACLLVSGLALACGGSGQAPDQVLLITIDTLRADHVGCYGAEGVHTPTLDGLAAQGVRFEFASAPAPLTLPSHISLMTALDPPDHGVRHNSVFRLDESIPTLAERMRAGGYATGAFVAAFVLDEQFGLARGFDLYEDDIGLRRASRSRFAFAERPADQVVDAALAWLEQAPERFFLWLHLYDPHAEYRAPPGFAIGRSAYDGEVSFADAQVGRLLEAVRTRWPAAEPLVAVTSDHGEDLGDHGEMTHSYTIYEATQHVPLIISGGGLPRGRVVSPPVRLIDVAPTLLELVGLEPLPGTGRSLLPLIDGKVDGRTGYVETLATQLDLGWSPLLGLRTEQYKYIRAPRPELYDLTQDPSEQTNLAEAQRDVVAELDRQLEARLQGSRDVAPEALLDSAARARLESLGYVVPEEVQDPSELGKVGGIDPKDHPGLLRTMREASTLISTGRGAEALEMLTAYPHSGPRVALLRGMAALSAGETEAAMQAAEEVRENGAEFSARIIMGSAQRLRGELDAARREYEAAQALDPSSPAPLLGLGTLAEAEGDTAAAMAAFRQALEADSQSVEARWHLAALHIEQGQRQAADALLEPVPEERLAEPDPSRRLALAVSRSDGIAAALPWLAAAVRQNPKTPGVVSAYASALAEAGREAEADPLFERVYALEPSFPGAANNLAWSLARQRKDLDRALELALESQRAYPESAHVMDTLALVRLARGEWSQVLSLTESALSLDSPQAPRAHLLYLRAAALAESGRKVDALAALAESQAARSGAERPWMAEADALGASLTGSQ